LDLRVPVHQISTIAKDTAAGWNDRLKPTAHLRVPDERIRFLYDAAVRCLVLLSAGEVVPGPFTYRRFWFRDACFMIAALLDMGMTERCRRHIVRFVDRQKPNGFFHSQAGEWDSNGQVLWIYDRFEQCSQDLLDEDVLRSVVRGVKWIENKRIPQSQTPYGGLLPAGFSAEHLGPNDHYYWDNFWSLAGLEAAVRMMRRRNKNEEADRIQALAAEYRKAIFHSIESIPEWRARGGIPAAPGRRMDAGAVGSMVADYPLNLVEAEDHRWEATLDFLLSNCFHNGAFFQDMIHSGQNAYLTLAIAQSLLRREDERFRDLVTSVADMASPTGQWPEAVHPLTGGGCMGDGQHGWAAAEWVRMIRSLFVREEGDRLVIGSGMFAEWLAANTPAFGFGPTPTLHGPIAVSVSPSESGVSVRLDSPNGTAVRGDIRIPGHVPVPLEPGKDHYELQRRQS